MADSIPSDKNETGIKSDTFAMSFTPLYVLVALLALLGTTAILWLGTKGTVSPVALGWATLGILGGVFVFTLLLVLVYRVRVRPDGLRSFDSWGLFYTLPWGDINSVNRLSVASLSFLSVKSSNGIGVLVPLFLCDKRRFCESLAKHAGPNHLLAKKLDEVTS